MNSTTWMQHAWLNRLQTVLLMLFLLGLLAVLGFLLWGEEGVWILLGTGTLMLLLQPALSPWLVLRLYRSRPLQYGEAPVLFDLVKELARRAELPAVPALYLVDSPLLNAFTVGSRHNAVIALSSALLTGMNVRELAGVLAHETAHIRNNDIHVMSLADGLSRMTGMLSLLGQILLFINLPLLLMGKVSINWLALLVLMFAPQLAMLAQLGLSRVREFNADLNAAALTGDPQGLASALAKIDYAQGDWRRWVMPGWGSQEPSWLRTHPPAQERVHRLLALVPKPSLSWFEPDRQPEIVVTVPQRRPRYRIGGVWY